MPTGRAACGRPPPTAFTTVQIKLTQAGGITGAVVSRATNAALGAVALRSALRAIAAEAEQLPDHQIGRKTSNAPTVLRRGATRAPCPAADDVA